MAEGVIAAAAVVSAGVSINNTIEQRKQARVAKAQANFEEAKSRRRVIAEQRMLRAQTVAQAEAQGITGASSVAGAQSSLTQQAADTMSFQANMGSFQNQMNRSQRRINNASVLADVAGAAGSIANIYRPKE